MTPYQPQGTVYGTLLNFSREHALWTQRMHEAPYKAPPQAPVLYVKTANTFNPNGGSVPLPMRVSEVEVGASIGLVIGDLGSFDPDVSVQRTFSAIKNEACSVWPVAGCVLLNDLSVPHESYYRPPVKFKNLDGFLGVGTQCLPLSPAELAALVLEVRVNGALCQTVTLSELLRPAPRLLADVNEFMGLRPGDVLMVGTDCLENGQRPRARVGDHIDITAPGFAPLVHTVVEEAQP